MSDKGRITGVGGIFIKCDDPAKLRDWYKNQLGITTNDYGALFEFKSAVSPDQTEYLQWGTFPADTKYFEPSSKDHMLNLRVDDLEAMLAKLSEHGITVVGEIQDLEYGKFAHIMDPEGNKIELWEPIEPAFTDMAAGETHK